jgi:hypothetical protein
MHFDGSILSLICHLLTTIYAVQCTLACSLSADALSTPAAHEWQWVHEIMMHFNTNGCHKCWWQCVLIKVEEWLFAALGFAEAILSVEGGECCSNDELHKFMSKRVVCWLDIGWCDMEPFMAIWIVAYKIQISFSDWCNQKSDYNVLIALKQAMHGDVFQWVHIISHLPSFDNHLCSTMYLSMLA